MNKIKFKREYKKLITKYVNLMHSQKFDELEAVVVKIRKLQKKWIT